MAKLFTKVVTARRSKRALVIFIIVSVATLGGYAWANLIEFAKPALDFSSVGNFEGLFSAIAVSVAIITLVVGVFLYWQAERVARLNHRSEVILHCIDRYNGISTINSKLGKAHDGNEIPDDELGSYARHFYGELFTLKCDQFNFYLAGWVDVDTFAGWMRSTLGAFIKNRAQYGMSAREGWLLVAEYHQRANPYFYDIMSNLMRMAAIEANESPVGVVEKKFRANCVEAAFREVIVCIDTYSFEAREIIQSEYRSHKYFKVRDNFGKHLVRDYVVRALMRPSGKSNRIDDRYIERIRDRYDRLENRRRIKQSLGKISRLFGLDLQRQRN